MKKQVTIPPDVVEILEAEQRKVRSTLINYGEADGPESNVDTMEEIKKEPPKKRGRPRKDTQVKRKVEVEVEDENADEDTETRSKRFLTEIERQAGGDKKKLRELLTKRFVPLVDVLPPLPIKGDFDIELIRQSPYFFS